MAKIILTGYMGSGKTTIGRFLSQQTGMKSFDLDHIIEEKTNLSIAELFTQKGEIYFRRLEHQVFKDLVESDGEFILSIGGGTPCYANNHRFLNADGVISVHLKSSVKTLVMRLESEIIQRPLISGKKGKELYEFVAQHLFERNFYYNHAKYKVDTDNKTPIQISSEIMRLLT
jgi:shikimate kinase